MLPLLQQLLRESALLDSFIEVLAAENQSLLEGRFADLPAIARSKNELLPQLEAADAAREATLSALGLAADRSGADQAAQANAAVGQAWMGVVRRAERARDLNLAVAAKVYTNLEFAGDALAFLQQRSEPLYGPDGARHTRAGRNTLAVG